MKATVISVDCDGSNIVGLVLRLHDGAVVKPGDILVRDEFATKLEESLRLCVEHMEWTIDKIVIEHIKSIKEKHCER
jgi:hypothetical protein